MSDSKYIEAQRIVSSVQAQIGPIAPNERYKATAERPRERKTQTEVVQAFDAAFAFDATKPEPDNFFNSQQYKKKVTNRDQAQLMALVRQQTKQHADQKTITIFDHGAGDGRLMATYEEIAKSLPKGTSLEVIAYDTSKVGLKCFDHKLAQNDYAQENSSETKNHETLISQRSKDNLTVKLVWGALKNSPKQIETITKKYSTSGVDIVLSFDTLSHIPGSKNRIDLLKKLAEIAKGDLLVTAPSIGTKKWEGLRCEFEGLRAEGDPGLAKEAGDLLHGFDGKEVFYHLSSLAEFIREGTYAQLKRGFQFTNGIIEKVRYGVNQFWHPQRHREVTALERQDAKASDLFSKYINEKMGTQSTSRSTFGTLNPELFNHVDGFFQLHVSKKPS